MKALIPVGLAVLLTTAATTAEAVPVLDQSNPASGGESFNDSLEQQQQVTDGIAGTLAGIELFALPGHSDTVTVKVGVGSGFYSGPFAFTASALLTDRKSTRLNSS